MEKDVVCCLECPWFLYGTPYSKWYVHEEKINTCVSEYTTANGLCLMAIDFLFLNLWKILLCTLMMTVFLQTVKNNSHHLQEMQTTCKAQTSPIIRSQKASSVTSSGISNFQNIRQNFWHQSYNSVIYYTTQWCSKFKWFSWKFKSCKFHRTCTKCDGFV